MFYKKNNLWTVSLGGVCAEAVVQVLEGPGMKQTGCTRREGNTLVKHQPDHRTPHGEPSPDIPGMALRTKSNCPSWEQCPLSSLAFGHYRNPHWPTLCGPCSHSPFCPPSSLDGCPSHRLPWAPWASQTTALFSPHCNYCLIVCSCIKLHSVRAGTKIRSGLLTCAFPTPSTEFWLTERPKKKKMLN